MRARVCECVCACVFIYFIQVALLKGLQVAQTQRRVRTLRKRIASLTSVEGMQLRRIRNRDHVSEDPVQAHILKSIFYSAFLS